MSEIHNLFDAIDAATDCIKRGYECAVSNEWSRERAKIYAETLFPTLSNAVFLDEQTCIALFMKGFDVHA